jgi:ABC-type uncharacterized transport system permease subunit
VLYFVIFFFPNLFVFALFFFFWFILFLDSCDLFFLFRPLIFLIYCYLFLNQVIFCAQTIAKLLNKFIQVACLKIVSTSSSSTHTHCLINLLKNSSEGLSEVDAHSIEPCVFCNHFFTKFGGCLRSRSLKFGRRILVSFTKNATFNFAL